MTQNLAPEWKNYRLDGVQADYFSPKLLQNSVIEGEHAGILPNQASCTTCHDLSSVKSYGTNGLALLQALPADLSGSLSPCRRKPDPARLCLVSVAGCAKCEPSFQHVRAVGGFETGRVWHENSCQSSPRPHSIALERNLRMAASGTAQTTRSRSTWSGH